MANRIFRYARAKRRKISIQPIRGAPSTCSFCGGDLSVSALNASSLSDNETGSGPLAVICAHCIQRLEPLCRLMTWYQRFNHQKNDLWTALHGTIQRRLGRERARPEEKQVVADLLLRLLKRCFSIIAGYKVNGYAACPRTGVTLSAPRVAVICADPDACIRLAVAGAETVGLPHYFASVSGAPFENPVRELRARCNHDQLLVSVGLLVLDYYAPILGADVGAIFVLSSPIGVPGGVEIVQVPII